MKILNFFLYILFFMILNIQTVYPNELRSLDELINNNESNKEKSIEIMQRCAAIYGALYYINTTDINYKEYENRSKIFLQSAILEDIKINNKKEEIAYKNNIDEFKSTISFIIQIFLQNMKTNNSFLKDHWIENDFIICEKY
tara:strand:+ start:3030 stop:3455 length:426 start_codon:yes stop_codon:yes gene_type:complete